MWTFGCFLGFSFLVKGDMSGKAYAERRTRGGPRNPPLETKAQAARQANCRDRGVRARLGRAYETPMHPPALSQVRLRGMPPDMGADGGPQRRDSHLYLGKKRLNAARQMVENHRRLPALVEETAELNPVLLRQSPAGERRKRLRQRIRNIGRAMKKRGMAWAARGASNLAKLIFAWEDKKTWN